MVYVIAAIMLLAFVVSGLPGLVRGLLSIVFGFFQVIGYIFMFGMLLSWLKY
jgi:hypothetical protein